MRRRSDESRWSSDHQLLRDAAALGFSAFDTAPVYGDAESIIGSSGLTTEVHTKVDPDLAPHDSLARSLQRLQRSDVSVLYFHDPDIALNDPAALVEQAMAHVGSEVAMLGASVYDRAQFEAAAADGRFGAIQLPVNVFDRRVPTTSIQAAADAGILVLARSVLLQGVIVAPPGEIPDALAPLVEHVAAFRRLAAEAHSSPMEAAFAWVREIPGLHGLVVGAETSTELAELVAALGTPRNEDLANALAEFAPPDESLVDPRRWPR
jgi:aryl-alcohol dehydrogenase-like predicted oxidoreductase